MRAEEFFGKVICGANNPHKHIFNYSRAGRRHQQSSMYIPLKTKTPKSSNYPEKNEIFGTRYVEELVQSASYWSISFSAMVRSVLLNIRSSDVFQYVCEVYMTNWIRNIFCWWGRCFFCYRDVANCCSRRWFVVVPWHCGRCNSYSSTKLFACYCVCVDGEWSG